MALDEGGEALAAAAAARFCPAPATPVALAPAVAPAPAPAPVPAPTALPDPVQTPAAEVFTSLDDTHLGLPRGGAVVPSGVASDVAASGVVASGVVASGVVISGVATNGATGEATTDSAALKRRVPAMSYAAAVSTSRGSKEAPHETPRQMPREALASLSHALLLCCAFLTFGNFLHIVCGTWSTTCLECSRGAKLCAICLICLISSRIYNVFREHGKTVGCAALTVLARRTASIALAYARAGFYLAMGLADKTAAAPGRVDKSPVPRLELPRKVCGRDVQMQWVPPAERSQPQAAPKPSEQGGYLFSCCMER